MPRKGHTPEQILNKLRQVVVAVANGNSVDRAVGRKPTRRLLTVHHTASLAPAKFAGSIEV